MRPTRLTEESKFAVLVGVGAYPQSSGLNPLQFPARDVANLSAELKKQGYLVISLVDVDATRGAIRRTLRNLAEAMDNDKNRGDLVFFFSGHGFEENGHNYLAAYNTVADDLKGEGLLLDDVLGLVSQSPARRKILFIDACRNVPPGKQAIVRTFKHLPSGEGYRILYSTRESGTSYEYPDIQEGVFTHFLILGLRGEAAEPDGQITFHGLALYVTDAVKNFSLQKGNLQVPFEGGESRGEFLLGRVTRVPAAPAVEAADANAREGLKFLADQKYREAISSFTKAMEVRPSSPEEYYYRGIAHGHLLEFSLAIDDFTTALDLGGDVAEVYGNRGYAYSSLQQSDRAIRDFTRAIELKPNYFSAYLSRGRAYYSQSNYKEAVSDFSKVIEIQPNLPAPFLYRAFAHAALGGYSDALNDFSKAIELDPDNPGSYVNRGDFHAERGEIREALTDYASAIQRQPSYPLAFAQRAHLLIDSGNYKQAIEDYTKAIDKDPSFASAFANRGYARAALKQYKLAIQDCTRAIELQPDLPEAYNNRGFAYASQKNFRAAIKDYNQAIQLRSDFVSALKNRAIAKKAVGDIAGSEEDLNSARSAEAKTDSSRTP